MHNQIGKIGPYNILEVLNQGGMGVLYRGRHEQSGEIAAVKKVLVRKQQHVQRIRREIVTLSQIEHPGIVKIKEQGVFEGYPWYAMELIEGETLGNILKNIGSQIIATKIQTQPRKIKKKELRELLTIIHRLCYPLAYLHGEGIVHSDLKPYNIMIKKGGRPVIIDFGLISRFSYEFQREQMNIDRGLAGTPEYMAPEQILNGSIDARTDIYALGCILYEVLTGDPPFITATSHDVLTAHLNETPPHLSQKVMNIPAQLERLVEKMLQKDPQHRIGYTEIVASTLAEIGVNNGYSQIGPQPKAYLFRPGLIGRDNQLSKLEKSIKRLKRNQGGLVFVTGESGIGKTRLLSEFSKRLTFTDYVFSGECYETSNRPLEAFLKPLQSIGDYCREYGRRFSNKVVGKRGKVLSVFEHSFEDIPGQDRYPDVVQLPLKAARLRLYSYLAEMLVGLTKEQAVVILLDDLQWADELSLEFIQFLSNSYYVKENPLLIIGAVRIEETPEQLKKIMDSSQAEMIRLQRLNTRLLKTMIRNMFAVQAVPTTFAHLLDEYTGGNPFFLAEYLRHIVEQGILNRDRSGKWDLATIKTKLEDDFLSLPVPHSIQDLIARRVKDLSSELIYPLRIMTVVNRAVSLPLLLAVTRWNKDRLILIVNDLIRRQILIQSEDNTYHFVHQKFQEVLYAQLEKDMQISLHRLVAEAMETTFDSNLSDYYIQLAEHWEKALHNEKACKYYHIAARAAMDRFSLHAAEKLSRKYLQFITGPNEESVTIRYKLGTDVLYHQSKFDAAIAELKNAVQEAEALNLYELQVKALKQLGFISLTLGNFNDTQQYINSALDIVHFKNNYIIEAEIIEIQTKLLIHLGNLDRASNLMNQVLTRAIQMSDKKLEASCYHNLALIQSGMGQWTEAQKYFQKARIIYHESGNKILLGVTITNIATMIACEDCHTHKALTYYRQALKLHRETGDRRTEAITLMNIADILKSEGRINQAWKTAHIALRYFLSANNKGDLGIAYRHLSSISSDLDRIDEAKSYNELALQLLRETGNIQDEIDALKDRAEINLMQNQIRKARSSLKLAYNIAHNCGLKYKMTDIFIIHAYMERRITGNVNKALKYIKQAETYIGDMKNLDTRIFISCERGHCYLAQNKSASECILQCEKIKTENYITPGSYLNQSLQALKKAQQAFERGDSHLLFRGEYIPDIPKKYQHWFDEKAKKIIESENKNKG